MGHHAVYTIHTSDVIYYNLMHNLLLSHMSHHIYQITGPSGRILYDNGHADMTIQPTNTSHTTYNAAYPGVICSRLHTPCIIFSRDLTHTHVRRTRYDRNISCLHVVVNEIYTTITMYILSHIHGSLFIHDAFAQRNT